jgi:hypothetical protein
MSDDQAFLDAHGVAYETLASSSRSEIVDIAEQARSYTFLIECLESLQVNAAVGQGPKPKINLPPPEANVKVGQRVVLYEEDPNDPSGKSYIGSAEWRIEGVPPSPGQQSNLAVRADIEIPERHISVRWLMRPNNDKTLPASHTVEVKFTLTAGFAHGGITNIPGVLMKQSESARGVPLAGLAVKVTPAQDRGVRRDVRLLAQGEAAVDQLPDASAKPVEHAGCLEAGKLPADRALRHLRFVTISTHGRSS